MTWTTPRTWTTSETVTASIMNTHVRDNLEHLIDNGYRYGGETGGSTEGYHIWVQTATPTANRAGDLWVDTN